MEIENMTTDIQKKMVTCCNIFPTHVDLWRTVLKEIKSHVKALCNFAEQLRFVEKADIKYMENFNEAQLELQSKILAGIEEELVSIKIHIEKLNRSNHELKTRLSTLERSTIDLDWDQHLPILRGTPIQPPLNQILQLGYDFWRYFAVSLKNINSLLKQLDLRDEISVKEFETGFNLDFDEPLTESYNRVIFVLAITQYVINEKAVT